MDLSNYPRNVNPENLFYTLAEFRSSASVTRYLDVMAKPVRMSIILLVSVNNIRS